MTQRCLDGLAAMSRGRMTNIIMKEIIPSGVGMRAGANNETNRAVRRERATKTRGKSEYQRWSPTPQDEYQHKSPPPEQPPDIHPMRKKKQYLSSEQEDVDDCIPVTKSIKATKEGSTRSVPVLPDPPMTEIGKILGYSDVLTVMWCNLPHLVICDLGRTNTR